MNKKKSQNEHYKFHLGEKINNEYWVHSQIGRGSFGTVLKAYNINEKVDVALKFLKNGSKFTQIGMEEKQILELIKRYNKNNRYAIITYLGTFQWKNHFCIVMPLYNYNLYYSVKNLDKVGGFSFSTVKKIATQLLECLHFLQHPKIRLIHTDIKPDNILLVSSRSFNIKLIDFGNSIRNPPKNIEHILQTVYYRSPEIILDLPFSYAIDMWSLGCVLIEIKTGEILFKESHNSDILRRIINICGMPPINMIEKSPIKGVWFKSHRGQLVLKELNYIKKIVSPKSICDFLFTYLEEEERTFEKQEYDQFLDLVTKMLVYRPNERITPVQALKHPFINSPYEYSYDESKNHLHPLEVGNFGSPHTVSETNLITDFDSFNFHDKDSLTQNFNPNEIQKVQSFQNLPYCGQKDRQGLKRSPIIPKINEGE